MWTFISLGLAVPTNYNFVQKKDNCLYYTGPVQESGSLPIRVECHWKEISLEMMDRFLGDVEGQTTTYSSVSTTKIIERSNALTIINQIHTDSRMSPREANITFFREKNDKRIIHRWWLSDVQPALPNDHTPIQEHQGLWVLEEHPDGGIHINYESTYLPGGNIPSWLVRQFQTSAIIRMIEETYQSVRNK